MRNLFALVGAFVITFGGLGWYLNWFKIQNSPAPTPGHRSLNIDIDTVKITDDIHRGSVKVQEALEKTKVDAEAKAKATTDGKADPAKLAKPDDKKPLFGGGEEAEEHFNEPRKPPY